jgi:hypothetical protein
MARAYPNDEKQIIITFVGLAVAAVVAVWLIMISVTSA